MNVPAMEPRILFQICELLAMLPCFWAEYTTGKYGGKGTCCHGGSPREVFRKASA